MKTEQSLRRDYVNSLLSNLILTVTDRRVYMILKLSSDGFFLPQLSS